MAVQRFYLTYSEEKIKDPIIYTVGHKFSVVTNIRGASIASALWTPAPIDAARHGPAGSRASARPRAARRWKSTPRT